MPQSTQSVDLASPQAFVKLRPRTLVHQVMDVVVARAAEGLILPGDRLVETELAEQLGVSRVPVREAMRLLESQGVVVNEPYKGIRLTPVTHERIDHLIEVRVALETTAAVSAIRRNLNDEFHLRELENIVHDMEGMAARNEVSGFASIDTAFHRTLCNYAGNAVLSAMWKMLARQMTIIFGLAALDKPMASVVEEHWELIRVLRSGRVDHVERVISAHIDVEIRKIDLDKIIAACRAKAAVLETAAIRTSRGRPRASLGRV